MAPTDIKESERSQVPNILYLEDSVTDAELVEYELRRAGIEFVLHLVDCESGFLDGLNRWKPDIILSDFSLANFNCLEALRLMNRAGVDIPFILVAGAHSEQSAVECMREGAADYILKTNLMRLASSVRSALKSSAAQKQKTEALAALQKSEEQLLQKYLAAQNLKALPATLDDYVNKVVAPTIESQKRAGAVAIKFEMAYLRSLKVDRVSPADDDPRYDVEIDAKLRSE